MAPSAIAETISALNVFDLYNNIVNGKASATAKYRNGINPATRENLPKVPVSTKEDVDAAVEAGRVAFDQWSKLSRADRQVAVIEFAEALEARSHDFSKLLTMEQGKPLAAAGAEVMTAVMWLNELAKISLDPEIITESETSQTITRYTPLGVCVAIVPWNFPIHLACGKIAPALVTGNTLIIKPSPFTPYCGLKLVELAQQFFPPGVIQVLSGDDDLGPWLTEHPDIDKISFTGSTATGRRVMQSASGTLKRVTLELGGNDPAIVCEDVDIESTAQKIVTLAFKNSGQICIALKRIYIQDTIYTPFRDAMVRFTQELRVGNGLDPNTTHGPLQNEMQYDRVRGFFKDMECQKWCIATGGLNDENAEGYFITPTIIDNPSDNSRIVVEEPFGPIVPILSWHSEEEVIARANNTPMGLGASVWTKDVAKGRRIALQLEAGNVWVNNHMDTSPNAPFGGHKQSGLGVEWGLAGLRSFCNTQTLYLMK